MNTPIKYTSFSSAAPSITHNQSNRKLTEEQKLIVTCNSDRIYIQAYAGSGKTTTLEEYTKVRPNERFLYLAFNKTVQESASKRFTKNVECRTLDSICLEIAGTKSAQMKDFNYGLVKSLCEDSKFSDKGIYWKVFNLLKRFLEEIEYKTISSAAIEGEGKNAISKAEEIWNSCLEGEARWFSHIINRKIALIKDNGNAAARYLDSKFGTILVDECQDINAIMLAIIEKFKGRKVFIGDTHQSIYSFMGCINAFNSKEAKNGTHLNLSQSFRFNNTIAERADWIVSQVKDISDLLVRHNDSRPFYGIKGDQSKTSYILDPGLEPNIGKRTILSRLNNTLFSQSYEICSKTNTSIHWNGKAQYFKKITDLIDLFTNPNSWENKKEQAEEAEDQETLLLMEMIETETPEEIEKKMQVIDKCSTSENIAEVFLSTVHKAKGLEWGTVIVSSDIGYCLNKAFNSYKVECDKISLANYQEECNIYYVAVTRATKILYDNSYTIVRSSRFNTKYQSEELFDESDFD